MEEMNLILKATQYNWGLKYPGCWESRSWLIYDDGKCEITVCYVHSEPFYKKESVSSVMLSRLKNLCHKKWEKKRIYACDGSAWTITAYDEGKPIQSTGPHPRYIYHLKVLEEIASLLPRI